MVNFQFHISTTMMASLYTGWGGCTRQTTSDVVMLLLACYFSKTSDIYVINYTTEAYLFMNFLAMSIDPLLGTYLCCMKDNTFQSSVLISR